MPFLTFLSGLLWTNNQRSPSESRSGSTDRLYCPEWWSKTTGHQRSRPQGRRRQTERYEKSRCRKSAGRLPALEGSQKGYASQDIIDILEAAESAIEALVQAAEDRAVAQTVIDQIENLKEITHLEQEADIIAARTAYENLTEA